MIPCAYQIASNDTSGAHDTEKIKLGCNLKMKNPYKCLHHQIKRINDDQIKCTKDREQTKCSMPEPYIIAYSTNLYQN